MACFSSSSRQSPMCATPRLLALKMNIAKSIHGSAQRGAISVHGVNDSIEVWNELARDERVRDIGEGLEVKSLTMKVWRIKNSCRLNLSASETLIQMKGKQTLMAKGGLHQRWLT
jgi:hypothetical protein